MALLENFSIEALRQTLVVNDTDAKSRL